VKPPTLSESQMQTGITRAAKQLGYLVFHTTYAIGSEKGYPDLHIVGHGRSWFLELKGPKPKIYPEQEAWIEALQAHGYDARFVFPADYETVLAELMQAYEEQPA
jgi:hypothetical protein